jgi:hypothetical protein
MKIYETTLNIRMSIFTKETTFHKILNLKKSHIILLTFIINNIKVLKVNQLRIRNKTVLEILTGLNIKADAVSLTISLKLKLLSDYGEG